MARHKSEGSNGDKRVNKMELVREALSTLGNDAMPGDIASHIQTQHGITMTPNMVSNYKSSILKKLGLSPRRRGRRRARAAAAEPRQAAPVSDGISMKDIRTLHEIASRLGIGRLRELVELIH